MPEGTRVIEYAAVTPQDRRGKRIELVEDLTITPRGADPNYLFYHPRSVTVDHEGRIYVVDSGNARVQVFDAAGEYLHTLGRRGQGPGEFTLPLAVAVVGDRVVVSDPPALRLSIWDRGGNHLGTHSAGTPQMVTEPMFGTDNGTFVADYRSPTEGSGGSMTIASFSANGEELTRFAEVRVPARLRLHSGPSLWILDDELSGFPQYAASRDGLVYLTAADEYQVLALDPSGGVRWALRVGWERQAVGEADKQEISGAHSNSPEVLGSDDDWPELLGALSRLGVDGHGRLYVFPHVSADNSTPGSDIPVDVYSADGERLLSAEMAPFEWSAAVADSVYGIRENPDSGEWEPIRYRLVLPGER